MQNRAYSILTVKSFDDDKRIIKGTATTPSVDRMGDVIDPLGVKFANPLAFLWQHEHDKPIGYVEFQKPTKGGIDFKAELLHPDQVESAALKERLQEAWDSIKTGLVRAVSIGFRAIEYAFMDKGGIHFQETEVFELSAVTIPANADALINEYKGMNRADKELRAVKAVDRELRHQAGIPDPEIPAQPAKSAASGEKKVRVVKLDNGARDRVPFVVRTIKRA